MKWVHIRARRTERAVWLFGSIFLFFGLAFSQSASRNFPTPIRSNEINGVIPARDLGDPRLTTHYYAFAGDQGDIFINVVTKNFDGDIDVFTADTLKPLTKVVVYSDASDNETGRVIYLRQSQKLILRIEGRTPNDQPASYRIKFAGSFAQSAETVDRDDVREPTVASKSDNDITVNSVGTIISVKPKPKPETVETEVDTVKSTKPPETAVRNEPSPRPELKPGKTDDPRQREPGPEKVVDAKKPPKPEVVVTDDLPKKEETKEKPKTSTVVKPKKPAPVVVPKEPNPLEAIRLLVIFKDGTKIERPMSEILKVGVDKGVLTIIHKDGSIGKYSILDVARMTIE